MKITHSDFLPRGAHGDLAPGQEATLDLGMTSTRPVYLLARIKENPNDLMYYARLLHLYMIQGDFPRPRRL